MHEDKIARYLTALRRTDNIAQRDIAGISTRFIERGTFSRDELYDALTREAENPSGAAQRVIIERGALPPRTVKLLLDEATRVGYFETPAMGDSGKMAYNRTHKYRLDAFIQKHQDDIKRAMRYYGDKMWGNPDLSVDYFGVSKYPVGGHFGMHTDNNGKGHRRRVSVVVGLNSDYEGGELFIDGTPFKLGTGDVIAFTSNLPHWVTPVTRGERINMALFLLDMRNMQPWETKDGSWY